MAEPELTSDEQQALETLQVLAAMGELAELEAGPDAPR